MARRCSSATAVAVESSALPSLEARIVCITAQYHGCNTFLEHNHWMARQQCRWSHCACFAKLQLLLNVTWGPRPKENNTLWTVCMKANSTVQEAYCTHKTKQEYLDINGHRQPTDKKGSHMHCGLPGNYDPACSCSPSIASAHDRSSATANQRSH